MFLLLLFLYSAFFSTFFTMSFLIHVPGIIAVYYIIISLSKSINYDAYHEESIEWIFSFIIISKMKYQHLLYIRNVNHKLHYLYKISKLLVKLFIKEFQNTLKALPVLIDNYLLIDINYTYKGISDVIQLYNEEFKLSIQQNMFVSIVDRY